MYMEGKTTGFIARTLTDEGIPTPANKEVWQSGTIQSILTSEKYRGSARLQKKFTVNFLTKETKKNVGELPQYWIDESHETIIAPEECDAVQDEVLRRKSIGRAYNGNSVISAKLVCGDCGEWFGSKTWHSNTRNKAVIWQCNAKFDRSKPKCETPHLTEAAVKERFLKVFNGMIANKKALITAIHKAKKKLIDTTEIDKAMEEEHREMEVAAELIRKCIIENSATAQDQTAYSQRYNDFVERYEHFKGRYDELATLREEMIHKGKCIDRFLADFAGRNEFLAEFDNCPWLTAIDRVTVRRDGVLVFRFQCGNEIEG